MKTKKRFFLLAFSALIFGSVHTLNAQVTIGLEEAPNANALLDLKENASGSASKGLLLPRVALTSTTAASPLTAHVAGMTVYNTATTTGTNSVTPGVYYNDGTQWIRQQEAIEIDTRTIVYVDTTDPNTATVFSFNAPDSGDFANNDALKASSSYIYVSTDGRTWYYNGSAYISYTQPTVDATAWYISGTTNDAGSNKTARISRNGRIEIKTINATDKNNYTEIREGGIELCRTLDGSAGTVNGYIDFKGDPTVDFDMRMAYNTTLNQLSFYSSSTQTTKVPLALSISGGFRCKAGAVGSSSANVFNIQWTSSTPYLWIDGVNVGKITVTSDRRLKENITPLKATALNRVMQLKPVSFNYKNIEGSIFTGSDKIEEGFVADELQEIIPSAVSGEKDALTESGEIQPQTLNWAPIVSVLTKAMQEQQELIETLLQRIEALEANKQ